MRMRADPYSVARSTRDADRVDKVLGRKDGGRVPKDDTININIKVNEKPEQEAGESPLAALAAAAGAGGGPPPSPMGGLPPPPMPMPPIGGGGPGPIAGMRRGGRVSKSHGGATSVAGKIQAKESNRQPVADTDGVGLRKARGGSVPKKQGGGSMLPSAAAATLPAQALARPPMPGRSGLVRKDGGKVPKYNQGGAGGGWGRLEKSREAAKQDRSNK